MIPIRDLGLLNDALQKPRLTVNDGEPSNPLYYLGQSRPSTKGTNSGLTSAYVYAAVDEDRPCPMTETVRCNFFYFR